MIDTALRLPSTSNDRNHSFNAGARSICVFEPLAFGAFVALSLVLDGDRLGAGGFVFDRGADFEEVTVTAEEGAALADEEAEFVEEDLDADGAMISSALCAKSSALRSAGNVAAAAGLSRAFVGTKLGFEVVEALELVSVTAEAPDVGEDGAACLKVFEEVLFEGSEERRRSSVLVGGETRSIPLDLLAGCAWTLFEAVSVAARVTGAEVSVEFDIGEAGLSPL